MYNKKGEGFMANTYEQHLAMKKKGHTHTKPATKKRLLKNARKRKSWVDLYSTNLRLKMSLKRAVGLTL